MSLVHGLVFLLLGATPAAPPDPATLKDKVSIEPGKRLAVRFEMKGDVLTDPKVVEVPEDDSSVVRIDCRKQGNMILLVVRNPYRKDMSYRALMRVKGSKAFTETTIVPVKAGLLGIEAWGDPIEEFVLFEFKLAGE